MYTLIEELGIMRAGIMPVESHAAFCRACDWGGGVRLDWTEAKSDLDVHRLTAGHQDALDETGKDD